MSIELYQFARGLWLRRVPLFPQLLRLIHRLVFSVVLPSSAQLGKGVLLSYQGLRTVILRRVILGDFLTIGAGVSIGGRPGHHDIPAIGNSAMVGSDAEVLGPVRIGQYASIDAKAVVLTDIADYAVAAGIPARVIKILAPDQLPNYFAFDSKGREA